MKRLKFKTRSAFTLLEVIIVVGVLGLIATMAMPSFMRARRKSMSTAAANDYRKAADGFETYAAFNGDYPADAAPGVVPTEIGDFMPRMDWEARTPVGGQWDWDGPGSGFTEYRTAVSIFNPSAGEATMLEVDKLIDDGDLSTGLFIQRANGYAYILEK